MDYLLGTQGLLTASGHEYVKHGNKTLLLVGYSLGAMDVSNLAALGYAKNAYAFSLPALNVGVRQLGVMNGIWDPVNLGGVGWLFAPHAKWENVGLRCHADYCYTGARGLNWEP